MIPNELVPEPVCPFTTVGVSEALALPKDKEASMATAESKAAALVFLVTALPNIFRELPCQNLVCPLADGCQCIW